MTPAEEERYVRDRWSDYHTMTYGRFDICDVDGCMDWYAAYLFTEQREADIADVKQEIILLRSMIALLVTERGDMTTPVYQRILAREQAALADLRRGWKEQG